MSGIGTTVPQYGVRFGDGEIDGPYPMRDEAQEVIDRAREQVAVDPEVADDYEPMTLMERTWRVEMTEWQPVRPNVAPDQDLINAATVIKRIATRPNRHPDTAAILLPIAEGLRVRALAERTTQPAPEPQPEPSDERKS